MMKVYRLAFLLYKEEQEAGGIWRRVTYNVVVNALAFFGVALLGSWLSEQLRTSAMQIRSQHERLQDLKVLHKHIVNSVPTGLITFNNDRVVTSVNAAGAKLMDLPVDSIIEHDITEFFRDLKFVLQNPDKEHSVVREESVLVQKRRRVYLGWTLSPLRDAHDQALGHTFMFQDVTRVRELEHTMRRSEKMAAIGELSAAIAHEIRNPLAAISGCVEMMSRAPNASKTDRKLMTIVQRETQQLNQWISDFLNYSRPSPLRMQVVDFDQLAQDAIDVFQQDASIVQRGIVLTFQGIGPAHVLADHSRMKQVIWNLLTNAEQSMESGTIAVEMRAALASSRPTVDLRIADEGSGIAKEDLERIFEPFFTTKERGTGLGLSVMHRIIEDHDGRIVVDSTVGKGTTFTITLPLTAPDLSELRGGTDAG
jgi:two-component system sensor histidine kinase PilS (NtrC family)